MIRTPTPDTLADVNLFEAIREHARWQSPCECVEQDGLLLVAGPNAFPVMFRNCALRIDPAVAAADVLERAREFFNRRRRGFTLALRARHDADLDAAAQNAGLSFLGETPCMLTCDLPAQVPLPEGLRIERLRELRHVEDAAAINAEAYRAIKLPSAEALLFFGRPQELLSPRIIGFVAYEGDKPVSTALTVLSGPSAGVYWVGTIESARGRGLGRLCTSLATRAGFDSGASVLTLQASPFGAPIYRRMGYQVYDTQRKYLQLPST